MISCHGLAYKQSKTISMLQSHQDDTPVSFQLFGADPEIMIEAAMILEEFKPVLIDINMGCPVRKVTKRGAGAALMTTPAIAEKIIKGIVKKITTPVSVKIRSGKNSSELNAVEFSKMLEQSGAAAVTVHGRTWSQGFTGTIDPSIIEKVKNAVAVPVIGNGDITSILEGEQLMNESGCDGVMIGRAALGNPWVFSRAGRPSSLALITAGAKEHLALIEEFLPSERILGYIKNQISRYFRGLPGCSDMRKKVFETSSVAELKQLLDTLSAQGSTSSEVF